jgi:hypothetical protein
LGIFCKHCGGFRILNVEIDDLDDAVFDVHVSHGIPP